MYVCMIIVKYVSLQVFAFRCVCVLYAPVGRGIAGCTACGRGHGGERPACSGACASSAASPSPWRLHLPDAAAGYRPDQAPPAPWGYWRLRPRSMWCCWHTAKAPAENEKKVMEWEGRDRRLLRMSANAGEFNRCINTRKHFYLCLEAERIRPELCDAVVLQENTLWVIRHTSWHYGEVLGLAADRHGRRVAHTQPGTCSHTARLHHHQPQNQP